MAEDKMNGDRRHNGRKTARDPAVFSHYAHRDANKKTEANGKTQQRKEQKGDDHEN